MYTPKHFKMSDDNEIFEFIHKNSFAILVSQNDGKMKATHIPILLKESEGECGFLYGHMAKVNDQLKNISEEVLVIFPGAHKYISSSWYESLEMAGSDQPERKRRPYRRSAAMERPLRAVGRPS